MRNRVISALAVVGIGAVLLAFSQAPVAGQAAAQGLPRSPDGHPDLNGFWQAMNEANWDLQDHSAQQGPVLALGAAFSIPAGMSVVEGGPIPYKPAALAKRNENRANWIKNDPEVKCFMLGTPRSNYAPYPFHIVQTPTHILISYQFAGAARTININGKEPAPVDTWMGWSNGRWEGNTLVVEVTGFNGNNWYDRAGNYQTENAKLVERWTPVTKDVINYEVTVSDPEIYTRDWKMSFPLYRRMDKNMQLMEYRCVEFAEEAMYGHLKKPGT